MPTYTWGHDDHEWDVLASVSTRDEPQDCPKCGKAGERRSWRDAPNIDKTSAGSWNQQSYNPGLGCWTENQKHAEKIAASRGLVPIGNEKPETVEKAMAAKREEIRESRWAEAMTEASVRDAIG